MNRSAVLFGLVSFAGASLLAATEVAVDETVDEDGDGHPRRVFHCAAKCGRDEVLVVHGTRWEDGRRVLETEEVVLATPDGIASWAIELVACGPNYWRLHGPAAEQHLQGVRLGRAERRSGAIEIELQPVTARRSYRFLWEARVESHAARPSTPSRRVWLPPGPPSH